MHYVDYLVVGGELHGKVLMASTILNKLNFPAICSQWLNSVNVTNQLLYLKF